MKKVYVIIDINEKINYVDALEFLKNLTEFIGINQYLYFFAHPSYKLRPLNDKNYPFLKNKIKNGKWDEIFFVADDQEGNEKIVDENCKKQFFSEQEFLLNKFYSLESQFENMFNQKLSLLKIIEEMGLHDFLLFFGNYFLSASLSTKDIIYPWIRKSLIKIPVDKYKNLVTEVQKYEATHDLQIISCQLKHLNLFDFSLDLSQNEIEIKISPLLGKTEEELLSFLVTSVNKLQDIYPSISAYLDVNYYQSSARTPHEECFNIFKSKLKNCDQLLRGYTRYTWIDMKKHQILGGDDVFNCVDGLHTDKRKNGYLIEIKNPSYENYAKLKEIFKPLLLKGETKICDHSIFERSVMLNTVVSENEFEIIDEKIDLIDKNELFLNKLIFRSAIKKFGYTWDELVHETENEKNRFVRRVFK